MKVTANFFKFFSFKKTPKKPQKNCNKSVKLHFYYSTQKYNDWQYAFPFLKENSKKIECCVYITPEEFSGSFPDYIILICKFKTDECFTFIKCFYFTSWRKNWGVLKNSKSLSPTLFANTENSYQPPSSVEKGQRRTLCQLVTVPPPY